MYESEANPGVVESRGLPAEVAERFAESRATVSRRSLLSWGEHCTECVWPTCYTSCDLYRPRWDGKCRRFEEGMVRIDCSGSLDGYVLKIRFKRWAKLWSAGNVRMYGLRAADRLTRRDLSIANSIGFIPVRALATKVAQKRYAWKKQRAGKPAASGELPNCVLIECYNPGTQSVSMTLTIRGVSSPIPFQALLVMQPGFNRHRVAAAEIARAVDLTGRFDVELTPNELPEGCELVFGALDFVVDSAWRPQPQTAAAVPPPETRRLCKCVVWDLDNTVWDGVLTEDGPEKLRLKPGIAEVFRALDERGILISAVSKNNPEDAMQVLRSFGLEHYFLVPQISWNPKSVGLRQIAESINVGMESLLFVDDSAFEREEVKSQCPEAMVLDSSEYLGIPNREDCQAPVTDESKKRRLLYREQGMRVAAQAEFQGDYFQFLRECNLRLTIRPMAVANLERVYELAQRTNQMNFSGNRYTREQLRELLAEPDVDTYVMDCEDRFGTYGTVGFCTVQRQQARMTDLMFSCRIQAKRVEHAFVSHVLRKYRNAGAGDFFVNFRKTKKNAPSGQVFDDFGFEIARVTGDVSELVLRRHKDIPDDGLIIMIANECVDPTSLEELRSPGR